jgi:glutamyl-tRNA synthetase
MTTELSHPRVRFAPSPTGYLHVGGARTALVNWLLAKKFGGTMVLRIEDTDEARSKPELTQAILDGLQWLSITWDEGPLTQSDRFGEHRKMALQLLDAEKAYRCFCTKEELDQRRKASGRAEAWRYDGACRDLNRAEIAAQIAERGQFVIRFKVPDGETAWDDLVHGRIAVKNAEVDDFILLRTGTADMPGTPVYMISVVSDDIFSRITLVLRGDDHISNTPKQILLYEAAGETVPRFGHLPLILGADKKRLSKRHGATAVTEYEAMGLLPESLFAFLAQLGLSYGEEVAALTAAELVAGFSLDNLKKSASVFDLPKLAHLNAQFIGRLPLERLREALAPRLAAAGIAAAGTRYEAALALMRTRARDLNDLVNYMRPFFSEEFPLDEAALARHCKPELKPLLEKLTEELAACEPFDAVTLEGKLRALADGAQIKAAALIHPLRLALLGTPVSPGVFEVAIAMGRDESVSRMRLLLSKM